MFVFIIREALLRFAICRHDILIEWHESCRKKNVDKLKEYRKNHKEEIEIYKHAYRGH